MLDEFLASQSMFLPSLASLLSDDPAETGQFNLDAPATAPPQEELWLVVLSHSLHLTATEPTGAVTISQVFRALKEFWTSNVPQTWEGYSACRRRAKKDRIKRDGKEAVEAGIKEQGDNWQFTWWESVDTGKKKEDKNGQGKWEEPKVDGQGNARLVLKGFEV